MTRVRRFAGLASVTLAALGAGCSSNVGGEAATATSATFATRVVSFTKGKDGGFGEEKLPNVVLGPPHGGGSGGGSTDVLSLGVGGEIVLGFDADIVDGAGPDFLVFENPFLVGGDPTQVWAELGEVSVSDDGVTWTTFPCTERKYPYGMCAGWHPVLATPGRTIDATTWEDAGGDFFDLSAIGVSRARFVRIRDVMPHAGTGGTAGFDLDAVAVLHGRAPS